MAEIIWTKCALNELNALVERVEDNNPAAAKKLVKTLFHKIDRLELFPESGRLVEEIKDLGYREIATGPCRIIYKTDKKTAFILLLLKPENDVRQYILKHQVTLETCAKPIKKQKVSSESL